MEFLSKTAIKELLGELPLTAELYWQLRQSGRPLTESFNLAQLEKQIPLWRQDLDSFLKSDGQPSGKRVLIFAVLRYWITHAALMGMALRGLGHEVSLAYLPYSDWTKPVSRFDLRRQNAYARAILGQLMWLTSGG